MIEARIVEKDESGNETTVLFPESHDLNGLDGQNILTNVARYMIEEKDNGLLQKILKSSLGITMFDGASVRNSQPLLESLSFTIDKNFPDPVYRHYAKPTVCNLATLGGLALLFKPKSELYWRIKIK